MTNVTRTVRRRLTVIGQAWQSFWFQPQPMYTLGVVRMSFGALAILWGLWLLPMRDGLLDANGVTPTRHADRNSRVGVGCLRTVGRLA